MPRTPTGNWAERISNADARDLISYYDARAAHLVGIGTVTSSVPLHEPDLTFQSAVPVELWQLPNGKSWNPTFFWTVTYVYTNTPRAAALLPECPWLGSECHARGATQAVLRTSPRFDGNKDIAAGPELIMCRWV